MFELTPEDRRRVLEALDLSRPDAARPLDPATAGELAAVHEQIAADDRAERRRESIRRRNRGRPGA